MKAAAISAIGTAIAHQITRNESRVERVTGPSIRQAKDEAVGRVPAPSARDTACQVRGGGGRQGKDFRPRHARWVATNTETAHRLTQQ
jgi:hypothetical protein